MANLNIKVEDVLKRFYKVKADSEVKGLYEVRNLSDEDNEEFRWYYFSSNNATYNSNGKGCFIRDINQTNSGYIERLKSAFEKAKERNKKIFWLVMVFGDGIGLEPKGYDWMASIELLVSLDSLTASLSMRKYPEGIQQENYLEPCCIRYEQDKYFNTTFISCKDKQGEFTDKYMKDYFRYFDSRPYHDVIKVLGETNIKSDVDNEKCYSIQELGNILNEMYSNADSGTQVASIHIFGIKYGKKIIENNYKPSEIIKSALLNDSYSTELNKALNTYKCLSTNRYGIKINGYDNRFSEADYINGNVDTERKTGADNIILYGVPGAGKSHVIKEKYCSDENYIERVVFHPDYMYSDFVGQILPKADGDKLKYEFTPGPFTKILKKAQDDPKNEYYLIVEEINRGNAPAIFGEIFQLLDRIDEDGDAALIGESKYGITNYDISQEVYGDEEHQVKIPSNLYILATMNTADQNVFTLDTAFQRRWDMKMIRNNIPMNKELEIEGTKIIWGVFASVINEVVINYSSEMMSSEDKRLGAYFVKKNQLSVEKFPEKVLKYLWDDAFKMDRYVVFKEEFKSLEDLVDAYEAEDKSGSDRLKAVIKKEIYDKMLSKTNDDVNDEEQVVNKDAETSIEVNA